MGSGGNVIGIGKISDIFAGRGISRSIPAVDNDAAVAALCETAADAPDGALVFANFNDFDTLYGHRRDIAGYAAALAAFDAALPSFRNSLRPSDLAIITADHGCDPSWRGTDHTREHVPVLVFGPEVEPCPLGRRNGFSDIGQTLARHLGVGALPHGTAFL